MTRLVGEGGASARLGMTPEVSSHYIIVRQPRLSRKVRTVTIRHARDDRAWETGMKRLMVGILLAGALIAGPAVAQQGRWTHGGASDGDRGTMDRFSAEDRAAFTDARIAALRAGLRLNADQDKLWPAVEDAIRGFVTQRREQMGASREQLTDDFPAAIRSMADRQAARAEALRRVADATAPLYATLDEGQKRRAGLLMRGLRPRGMSRPERDGGDHRRGRDNG